MIGRGAPQYKDVSARMALDECVCLPLSVAVSVRGVASNDSVCVCVDVFYDHVPAFVWLPVCLPVLLSPCTYQL